MFSNQKDTAVPLVIASKIIHTSAIFSTPPQYESGEGGIIRHGLHLTDLSIHGITVVT